MGSKFNILIGLFLLAGCVPPPAEKLPPVVWVDDQTAVRKLCERASAMRTVSSECALTLTRPTGQSIRLDGAVAMRLPGSVRVRAWKLGQAVLDLTATPDGLWIESPDDASSSNPSIPPNAGAARVARAMSMMFGDFFCGHGVSILDHGGARFELRCTLDGQRIACEVERATLTPRQYTILDADGIVRFTLALDRYQVISGIPWPTRLTAKSEGGNITIELKDPELNGELPANAFVPPGKAKRLP